MINIKVGDIVRHKFENRYSPFGGIAELYGVVKEIEENAELVVVMWFHDLSITDHYPPSLEVIIAS
jgi:hypothetical protein